MTFNEYQTAAVDTAIYKEREAIVYPTLGLCGEAGELANKVKKVYRDMGGAFDAGIKVHLADELGDCLWYIAALARDLGWTLDEVAKSNLTKLAARKAKGTLGGSGDAR